jgi:hypothetical protein
MYTFSHMFRVIIILVYDIFLAHSIFPDYIRQALTKNLQILVLVRMTKHHSQWFVTISHYIAPDHDRPTIVLRHLLYVLLF